MKRPISSRSLRDLRHIRLTAEPLEARELLAGDVLPTVTLQTNVGDISLEMRADVAPGSVANFLKYVTDGDYTNAIFHRLVPGFVLQGGGFTSDPALLCGAGCTIDDVDESQFDVIPTDDSIDNEFNLSNLRGTVAMAKLGTGPDTATNQFFVNLADNSGNLDNQNGGFTVFAQVVDMTVPDTIAEFPTGNLESIFPDTEPRVRLQAISAAPLLVDENEDISVVRIEAIVGEGVVQGTLRLDSNVNGTADTGDGPMVGYDVFLDFDDDGVRDSNEPISTTDSDGVYEFLADPGDYSVRIATASDYTEVSAATATAELGAVTTDYDVAQVYQGTSFHNDVVPTDVNAMNGTQPLDALLVINELMLREYSSAGDGALNAISSPLDTPLFIDVDNNLVITPLDALLTINELIRQGGGQAASIPSPALSAGLSAVAAKIASSPLANDLDAATTNTAALCIEERVVVSIEDSLPIPTALSRTSITFQSVDSGSSARSDLNVFDSVYADWL